MENKVKVEAEGREIIIRNSAGDYAIIPKNKREEVLKMLKDGCNGCIDSIVMGLPKVDEEGKAEDGAVISNGGKDPKKKATRQDSLAVYKSSLNLKKQLKNLGYEQYGTDFQDQQYLDYTNNGIEPSEKLNKNTLSGVEKVKEGLWRQRTAKVTGSAGKRLREAHPEDPKYTENIPKDEFYLKNIGDNKYLNADLWSFSGLNTDLPKALLDDRIHPQGMNTYRTSNLKSNEAGFDDMGYLVYDPLAVKPADMLTEEEYNKRKEKYGTVGLPSKFIPKRINPKVKTVNSMQPIEPRSTQPVNSGLAKPMVPKYWDVQEDVRGRYGYSTTRSKIHSQEELDKLQKKQTYDESQYKGTGAPQNRLHIKPQYARGGYIGGANPSLGFKVPQRQMLDGGSIDPKEGGRIKNLKVINK